MTQSARGSSGPKNPSNNTRKRSFSSANLTTVTPEIPSSISTRTHKKYARSSAVSSKRKKQDQPLEQLQQIHGHVYQDQIYIPHRMSSQRNVPAFLHKLYNMVEDPSTDEYVRWSNAGDTFLVQGHEEFAKQVLPRFYKHNTFTSFVRQLNMYDFHKIPHLQQGVLLNNVDTEVWEFSNPHFQKGRPELLALVTRKRSRDRDNADASRVNLGALVKEIGAIKKHQLDITSDLNNLHRDNEVIWKETLAAREKHQKHQQVISKILQFLAAIFSNDQNALTHLNNDMLEQQTSYNKNFINQNCSTTASQLTNRLSERNVKNYDSGIGSSDSISGSNSGSDDDVTTTPTSSSQSPSVCPDANRETVKLEYQTESFAPDNEELSYPESSCSPVHASMPNLSSRTAQAITNDIEKLQTNVEALADQLGIDTSQFPEQSNDYFQSNHSDMIFTASKSDKLRLFQLAADNCQHPAMSTSNETEILNHNSVALEQASKQQTSQVVALPMSSATSEYNHFPFFFRHLLETMNPDPTLSSQSIPSSTIHSMSLSNNVPHFSQGAAQSSIYFSDRNAVEHHMQTIPATHSSPIISTKPFTQAGCHDGQCTTSAVSIGATTVYNPQSTVFLNSTEVIDMPDLHHQPPIDGQEQHSTSIPRTGDFMAPPSSLTMDQTTFFGAASNSMVPSNQHSFYFPYDEEHLSSNQPRTAFPSYHPFD